MKSYEEERELGSSERHYGWGEQYIIGFEGSQELPVCPSGKCKLLTGTIYFFLRLGGGGYRGALDANFEFTIGRAACEAYRATWNLGTNSAFALGPRKTTENMSTSGILKSQFVPHRRHTSPLPCPVG
jgi:hypothetical protein